MIKLLTDENIPPAFVGFLRNKGFDVKDIRELRIHGASDSFTLDLARQDKRALITFDKHFGNILLYPLHSHYGIIRIRIHPPLINDMIQSFERFVEKFDLNMIGETLIILEREGFRVHRTSRKE
jgi:predicted nuclease of predicted toxin-antitoxin system